VLPSPECRNSEMPHNSNMIARFLDIYFVIFKNLQPSVCKLKPRAADAWSECLYFGIRIKD
jgi:hypothetical protein